jgi:methylase of polypeptide subunit release factors
LFGVDQQLTAERPGSGLLCAGPAIARRLRRILLDVGFGEAGNHEASRIEAAKDPWSLSSGLPTRDGSPFSTLVTLFCSGSPVERRQAESALAPMQLAELEKAGLLELRDGITLPRCLVRPHDGLIAASDVPAFQPDRVLGIVPAAETLARLTVRRPVRRALDLGTGCGVQALLLARHSESVIAVDVNPRALAFAAFNAALNEIGNVECREGSWFTPVAGERFDVITCNPPYVISPDATYVYRDGGLPRDTLCRTIVRETSEHLAEGGFATILCNWIQDGSGVDPIREWVLGTGCDALLLHYGTLDPSAYAVRWNLELRTSEPRIFEETVRRWLDYYRAEAITGIACGAAILRRRPGAPNWVRALEMAAAPSCQSSDHILRLFNAADFLELRPHAAELLCHAFALVDGHRLDQTLDYVRGTYAVGPAIFRFRPGLGLEARIDARALEVLLECDGRRTLGALVADVAARRGDDEAAVATLVEKTARLLVESGFMVPITDGKKGDGSC